MSKITLNKIASHFEKAMSKPKAKKPQAKAPEDKCPECGQALDPADKAEDKMDSDS